MIAIVANARTLVEVLAQLGGIGACTYPMIMLRNLGIGVMHQSVTDIINMLVIRLSTIMSTACTFHRTNTYAFAQPIGISSNIALIVYYFSHLSLDMGYVFSRKTADKNLGIIVIAFQLPKPNIGSTAIHGSWRDLIVVTHQKHIAKILVGIVVMAEDERLDLIRIVTAYVGKVDQGCWTTRLVFPSHKRLHGVKKLGRTNDQHLTLVGDKVVFCCPLPIVDETMMVHGIGFSCHSRLA